MSEHDDELAVARQPNRGLYDGKELRDVCQRPGAYDYRLFPSRIGNRLVYRDGRVEEITE